MPVRTAYRPLAVEAERAARSASPSSVDRLRRGAQDLLHGRDAAARVLDDAGGDADAAGAAGLGRAVADVDAASGGALDERVAVRSPARTSTKFASLFQYVEAEAIAGGVQQRLRLLRPAAGSRAGDAAIGERGLDRDDRGDVDAVDRDRRADRDRARRARRRGSRCAGRPGRTPSRTSGRR